MPRYAVLVSVVIAACSVELAEPDRSDPFTQIGGASGNGGSGGGGEEGGLFGGGGGPAGTGAGGAGGVGGANDSGTGDPCLDCELAFCPAYEACLNTPECAALDQCMAAATTPSAQVNCYNTWISAYDLFFEREMCLNLACPAACGWDPSCVSCEETNCGGVKSQCMSNDGCIGYWYCTSLCSDVNCFNACDTYWGAAGLNDFDAYIDCTYALCEAPCS